MFQKPPSDLSS